MRFLLSGVCLLLFQLALGQSSAPAYWQQKLKYQLTANVLPQEHMIEGHLNLEYTNQSPDTLSFIWFHLWPNAYANDKTALFKQLKQIKGRNKSWKKELYLVLSPVSTGKWTTPLHKPSRIKNIMMS